MLSSGAAFVPGQLRMAARFPGGFSFDKWDVERNFRYQAFALMFHLLSINFTFERLSLESSSRLVRSLGGEEKVRAYCLAHGIIRSKAGEAKVGVPEAQRR